MPRVRPRYKPRVRPSDMLSDTRDIVIRETMHSSLNL